MWISRIIWQLFGFGAAYIKNLHGAGFDLLRSFFMTKPQIGRFYWANLVLCAIVLYYLFVSAQSLRASDTFSGGCNPDKSLPILGVFMLAELASFVLLIGAQFEGWLLSYLKIENQSASHDSLSRDEAVRRLHRILWTWFPPVLAVSVYFSNARLDSVASWCIGLSDAEHYAWIHSFKLLGAVVWPGMIASFAVVVAANWLIFRWTIGRSSTVTMGVALLSYVAATAIVGPSDLVGVVGLLRQLPAHLDWLFKLLVGS